ncbi:hypothetical protein KEG38_26280 [Polyangium jinanense]|uniref:hypothetical protein n=1 Tax=Polyangium jinanense TaxID=2829994 RepID=UPI00233F8577|nr:hypothetical protein [Polyangium jinanense]MDC3957392.1 hypothetical protein [Polyangium jinanense]
MPVSPLRIATAFSLLVSLLIPENAAAEPPTPAESALLHDLEKIVESKANSGWKIDRYELETMMPDALQSLCNTPETARLDALTRQAREVESLGGPVAEAYRKNGGKLSGLSDLLAATRVHDLLTEALKRAPAECPFWITPSPAFRGLQTDAHRFTLNLETDGLFLLRRREGTFLPGAGGLGRLLLGRGLSERWTMLFGLEFGGWALIEQNEGETNFPLEFIGATPFVVRHVRTTWQFDLELAPVVFLTQSDLRPSAGGRVGVAVGVSTLRIRGIMPWAGVQLSTEFFPENGVRGSVMVLKGGARVGFDWDF